MTRALRSIRPALALAACLGLVDGARALREIPGFADRLGTMAVAHALYALLLVAAAGVVLIGLALARRTRSTPTPDTTSSGRSPLERGALAIVAVALLASLGVVVAGPRPEGAAANAGAASAVRDRPNLILISIDTLRADRVGAYQPGLETTPNLDRFASEAVLFETACSTASWTLPAHATMLTGLDPFAHGAIRSKDRLAPELETLAEMLRSAGYRTEAWVGTDPYGYVGSAFGFGAGFDGYRHYPHPKRFRSTIVARVVDGEILGRLERHVGNASPQIDSVIRWLRTSRRAPFFLFLHLYDAHSKPVHLPYEAPPPFFDRFCPGRVAALEPCSDGHCASDRLLEIVNRGGRGFSDRELEIVQCLYDGGVAYVDHEVGRLFEALEQQDLMEESVVIVTSDHGEAFFEHGAPLHTTLYEEITRIPLIIRAPGAAAGKRASGLVSLADVTPTLLALAGIDVPEALQGNALDRVVREWPERASGTAVGVSLRQTLYQEGAMKYIMDGVTTSAGTSRDARRPPGQVEGELYDLVSDAGERDNRIHFDRETAERLAASLAARREASLALRSRLLEGASVEQVELGAAERARLRALGYVEEEEANGD